MSLSQAFVRQQPDSQSVQERWSTSKGLRTGTVLDIVEKQEIYLPHSHPRCFGLLTSNLPLFFMVYLITLFHILISTEKLIP